MQILQVLYAEYGLFEDDKLIKENVLDNGRTHSENFMPLVKKTLEDANVNLDEIDYMGVVVGPGSFTGIRIGIASCKAMAEVKNIKIIPITALESLAANEKEKSDIICSMIDARNNQVYCGIFNRDLKKIENYAADDINNVLDFTEHYDNIIFVGDGAVLHRDLIEERMADKNIKFSVNNKQNVISLGIIAFQKMNEGGFLTADDIVPMYLRKSQAERMKFGR